jgi:Protein of unknown function (DUF3592)
MPQASNRGAQLFCWVFILVGVTVMGAGVWTLIKSIRTEHWPVTDAVIQSAHQESHSGDHGTTYSAEVTYTYQVSAANYTGRKISIGAMSSSSQYAQKILDRYPVGKKVAVYYSPTDPAEAVLETGIHGGTWICLGVGTAFGLAGLMFLQIFRAAAKAQISGALPSSVAVNPDGSFTASKPPVLMGVIFLLAGTAICFAPPDGHAPKWILCTVGVMFAACGLLMLVMRLENKVYSKIVGGVVLVLFLVVFHWVSFGPGERIGTTTMPFSTSHAANVRLPFAIATIFMDVVIVAVLVQRFLKRRKD